MCKLEARGGWRDSRVRGLRTAAGWATLALSTIVCATVGGPAPPQTREQAAATKVISIGGNAEKDADGAVGLVVIVEKAREKGKGLVDLTDADVASVDFGSFARLTHLTVVAGKITDRAFAEFAKIPAELRGIDLGATRATDKGLISLLKKQPALFQLALFDTPMSDATVVEIAKLKNLRFLTLANNKITDKGVNHLAQLKGLVSLDLSGTDISDGALAGVATISTLHRLKLNKTGVTDAGMAHLRLARNLRKLAVNGTKVSDDEKERMRKALAGLEFVD